MRAPRVSWQGEEEDFEFKHISTSPIWGSEAAVCSQRSLWIAEPSRAVEMGLFHSIFALGAVGVVCLFDFTLVNCCGFQEHVPVLFHSKIPNHEWLLGAAVCFQIYSELVEKVTLYDSVRHLERAFFMTEVRPRQCIERIIELPNLYSSARVVLYIMGLSSGSRNTGQIISQGWYVLVLFLQWIGHK